MNDQPEPQPAARTCGNCACFAHMLPDGTVLPRDSKPTEGMASPYGQTVCRRSPPVGRWVEVEVPVFDPTTGAPVMRRPGVQRMERKQVLEIGYPPAVHTGLCYDGWRPIGTRPGDNAHLAEVLPMVAELARGNMAAAKRLGQAMLDDLMAEMPPPGRRNS